MTVISASNRPAIQPRHISTEDEFWGSFGNRETEIAAWWIVRFFKENGLPWRPFSSEEIDAFYQRSVSYPNGGLSFGRLVNPQKIYSLSGIFLKEEGGGWVVRTDDNRYVLTHEFIAACYKASPAEAA